MNKKSHEVVVFKFSPHNSTGLLLITIFYIILMNSVNFNTCDHFMGFIIHTNWDLAVSEYTTLIQHSFELRISFFSL